MKILDLGCGNRKHPGAIGIDLSPKSQADIIHDLDRFPYPFPEDEFDVVICDSILEHLNDIILVMREVHRITKAQGRIKVRVPYFSSVDAFADPTHRHFFTYHSFEYFTEVGEYSFYTDFTFRILRRKIHFGRRGNILPGLSFLANRFPDFYERALAYLFPAQTIEFELEVVKDVLS
ncbi:MAG: methyltransferase domain-containing protein [Candidatus Binatia bacterium]